MTTANISFAPVLPAYNAAYDHDMISCCPESQDQMLQAAMANFQNSKNRIFPSYLQSLHHLKCQLHRKYFQLPEEFQLYHF